MRTTGEERIANELLLKLGLRVSPRTVRKYLPTRTDRSPGHRVQAQRWSTVVRNHAQAMVACDFCVVVTATCRLLDVLVVMEHATRRILHLNTTAHPTARWTMHQRRDAMPADHPSRVIVHDRDTIFSHERNQGLRHWDLRVLQSPPHTPQANARCERLLGTWRREGLDFMIPLTEHHCRWLLHEWGQHDHAGRPHMA